MHLGGMQVEVLRHAMEHKQDDLKALVEDNPNLVTLALANIGLASKALLALRSEVVAQIFASLYFIEGDIETNGRPCSIMQATQDLIYKISWMTAARQKIGGTLPRGRCSPAPESMIYMVILWWTRQRNFLDLVRSCGQPTTWMPH